MVYAVLFNHRPWWQVWSSNGLCRLGVLSVKHLLLDLLLACRNHPISNLKLYSLATHGTETIDPTSGILVRS